VSIHIDPPRCANDIAGAQRATNPSAGGRIYFYFALRSAARCAFESVEKGSGAKDVDFSVDTSLPSFA
jgi:hypothetical protein